MRYLRNWTTMLIFILGEDQGDLNRVHQACIAAQ